VLYTITDWGGAQQHASAAAAAAAEQQSSSSTTTRIYAAACLTRCCSNTTTTPVSQVSSNGSFPVFQRWIRLTGTPSGWYCRATHCHRAASARNLKSSALSTIFSTNGTAACIVCAQTMHVPPRWTCRCCFALRSQSNHSQHFYAQENRPSTLQPELLSCSVSILQHLGRQGVVWHNDNGSDRI
jgi:hypothetical protein